MVVLINVVTCPLSVQTRGHVTRFMNIHEHSRCLTVVTRPLVVPFLGQVFPVSHIYYNVSFGTMQLMLLWSFVCYSSSVIDGHEVMPAVSHPSLQHNGSTTDITNISASLPSAPDCDLRTDGNVKYPAVPPKKPLTPYMKFSKSVSASVCSCRTIYCLHILQFSNICFHS